MSQMTREEFVNALAKQHGVERAAAERAADRKYGVVRSAVSARPADTSSLRRSAEQTDPARSVQIRARRNGDALWMEIVTPPRTKKNHAESFGSAKSKPYKRYLADLVEAIREVRTQLALPLPGKESRPHGYNICAHFYVDVRGEAADLPGLEQGLYDALQEARVVENDWLFRQHDGSRVIPYERPRVALWITPILSVSLDTPEIL